MKEAVEKIIKGLVGNAEAVTVSEIAEGKNVSFVGIALVINKAGG